MPLSSFLSDPTTSGAGTPWVHGSQVSAPGGIFSGGLGGKGSSANSFASNWSKRINAFRAHGIDESQYLPVIRYDWNRVKSGSFPMGNAEAIAAIASLSGHDLLGARNAQQTPHGHGLIHDITSTVSNAASDLSNIAGSIPNLVTNVIPNEVRDALQLAPAIAREHGLPSWVGGPLASLDPEAKKRQDQILAEGKKIDAKIARGDWGGAIADTFSRDPILRDLPGAYTASTLAEGNFSDFQKHPLMHTLDVLPYVSKTGEGFAAGRLAGEEAPASSTLEALKAGNPLKAGFRSLLGTSEQPLSNYGTLLKQAAEDEGRKISLPRSSELVRRFAERYDLGSSARMLDRIGHDVAAKFSINRDRVSAATAEKLIAGFTREEEDAFTRAYQMGDRNAPIMAKPEAQLAWDYISQHFDAQAASEAARGNLELIPYGGKFHAYPINSKVAKAYRLVQKAEQRVTERERLAEDQNVTGAAFTRADERFQRAQRMFEREKARFDKKLASKPPASMHPVVRQHAIDKAVSDLRAAQEAATDPAAAARLQEQITALGENDLRGSGLTRDEWAAYVRPAAAEWQRLWDEGIRPGYLPNPAKPGLMTMMETGPLPDRPLTPGYLKDKGILSFEPTNATAAMRVTWYDAERLRSEATDELVNQYANTLGIRREYAEATARSRIEARVRHEPTLHGKPLNINQLVSDEVDRTFVPFDEVAGRLGAKMSASFPDPKMVLLPKETAKLLLKQGGAGDSIGMKLWDKSINAFRLAVTFSPRHVFHVMFSSNMFMALDEGPRAFLDMPRGFVETRAWAHNNPSGSIPLQIFQHYNWEGISTDEIRKLLTGQSLGEAIHSHPLFQRAGHYANFMRRLEENVSNTYRAAGYLYEKGRADEAGLSEEAARAQAIQKVLRTQMDNAGWAPIERQIQRFVFPFYGFTRQILRFILRYPADHPVRAAFLANLANMEVADRQSGLPYIFQNYLGLGGQSAEGMQTFIDLKTMNPFRSVELNDPFTAAGLISGLNPAVRGILSYMGVNTLTGNVQTNQQTKFDPLYGTQQDVHPNPLASILQSELPQSDALLSLLGMSSNLDYLKAQDKVNGTTEYRKTLMTQFGIPFVPFDENIFNDRIRFETNVYAAARNAVNQAVFSGNTAPLDNFAYLPFEARLATPGQIRGTIQQAQAEFPGVSPQSLLPSSAG